MRILGYSIDGGEPPSRKPERDIGQLILLEYRRAVQNGDINFRFQWKFIEEWQLHNRAVFPSGPTFNLTKKEKKKAGPIHDIIVTDIVDMTITKISPIINSIRYAGGQTVLILAYLQLESLTRSCSYVPILQTVFCSFIACILFADIPKWEDAKKRHNKLMNPDTPLWLKG